MRSMKVAWAHNTLHLILIAWGIALILASGAILLLTRQLDPLYEQIQLVRQVMPAYLPITLVYICYFMLFLSILAASAATFESRIFLTIFYLLSGLLLARLSTLVLEINYSGLLLSEKLEERCLIELMPNIN
jgi:hypothetical protein